MAFPSTPEPQTVQVMEATFKTLISGSGFEQRRAIWSYPRRTFILTYDLLDTYRATFNRDILYSFYLSQRGAFGSFVYTYPVNNAQITVRFADDGWREEKYGPSLWQLVIKLYELFMGISASSPSPSASPSISPSASPSAPP